MTATEAKQAFGKVLALAIHEPVAIERHGKIVAVVAPPSLLASGNAAESRAAARDAQKAADMRRLALHLQLAVEMLAGPKERRASLLSAARREVARWESDALCSADYIARWKEWLGKPARELASLMTSDAGGWGTAMRQNSPFLAAGAASR